MLRLPLRSCVVLLGLFVVGSCQTLPLGKPATESFDAVVDRQTDASLADSPELVTGLGLTDAKWIAKWGELNDRSFAHKQRRGADVKTYLAEIESFDPAELMPEERITQALLEWQYKDYLRTMDFDWTFAVAGNPYPVEQFQGVQKDTPQLLQTQHMITSRQLADLYIARIKALGPAIDAAASVMTTQANEGAVPPDFMIDRTIEGMDVFLAAAPEKNVLVTNLAEKLSALGDVPSADREAMVGEAAKLVNEEVKPAYRRLEAALKQLREQSKHDAGVWHLPQGDAYYAAALAHFTTTNMTPTEVHELGLKEVERIQGEMDKILRSQGLTTGSVGLRMIKLSEDKRYLLPESDAGREEALARFRALLDGMYKRLPEAFGVIPPQPLQVQPAPAYASADALGRYMRASPDGKRPGTFITNLAVLKDSPTWSMATITYHEGVPGHHFQNSRVQMLTDLPLVRRASSNSAYGEGWALYAERLADEMGMYKDDPLGRLGYLQAQLWRAVRLVVDTGMHAKHWSREQAIDYMHLNTGLSQNNVVREIERYAAAPGQACSYYVGMMKIYELRERAKRELGNKFDLKAFHEAVLSHGSLPLSVLETVVDDWIAQQKAS